MHKILEKRQLSHDLERGQSVYYFKVTAPEIARNRKAGQFIIFQINRDLGDIGKRNLKNIISKK